MSKNPIINALSASAYIILIVSIMTLLQSQKNKPDTFLAPMIALSLLTLSAAVMAYLFFYHPLQLLLEGKKKEAVKLFVQTVAIFAILPAIVLLLLFSSLI